VLLKASVVVLNEDFDPNTPYSKKILIIAHERICSYDETRMEWDCTRATNGKTDMGIKAGQEDGTSAVKKSSTSDSAFCGRLGDGRALPVFICFASGDSYEPAWTPHFVSCDIFDVDGKPLAWRCISNAKGSITEEYCGLYDFKDLMYPAMGRPKPERHHPTRGCDM
jgi:hypothetical protein